MNGFVSPDGTWIDTDTNMDGQQLCKDGYLLVVNNGQVVSVMGIDINWKQLVTLQQKLVSVNFIRFAIISQSDMDVLTIGGSILQNLKSTDEFRKMWVL